jgi:prepilin-type N-terminal cleavage/methylation domain-containing protein
MCTKGFTLIEVIITVSIMTIVSAIVVPLISMDFAYMDRMVDEFAMDIRYVQMENMKKPRAGYKLSIDKYEGCYYILKKDVIEKTVEFKERYSISYTNANMDSIGFNNDGTPINPGTFSITDTRTGEIREVSIVPTTGRTLIKE